MTAHDHTQPVYGCARCDLSRDEANTFTSPGGLSYAETLVRLGGSSVDDVHRALLGEIKRLRVIVDRRNQPHEPSDPSLTALHDRAVRNKQHRVWRTVEWLIHELDRRTGERDQARAHLDAARPVVEYVSRGRGFVDVERYPDATARRVLGAWYS